MSARFSGHRTGRTLSRSLIAAMLLAGWLSGPASAAGSLRIEESFGSFYPEEWGQVGAAVALSRDGNTALIGEPGDSCAEGFDCGAVYLYERLGGLWTLNQILHANVRQADARFGDAVALSGDAQTALVGAPGFDGAAGYECGAVYSFSRDAITGTWSARPGFSDPLSADGDRFGAALALDGTGSRALVGLPDRASGGAIRVLERDFAGNWTFGQFFWVGGAVERLGAAVALDETGAVGVGGAPGEDCDGGGTDCGAIWVLHLTGPSTASYRYVASDAGPEREFGAAVALSGDASTLLVGAPWHEGCGPGCGRAYLLLESASYPGEYVETGAFTPPEIEPYDNFGKSVALSGDGTWLAVGAPWRICGGGCGGSLYRMRRVGSSLDTTDVINGTWWTARAFGRGLALSGSGGVVLAGDLQEACAVPAGGMQCGGARIYSSLFADDFESGDLSAWSATSGGT